jgi:hypothetical protein
MADGDPLIIGQTNIATLPGAATILRRNQPDAATVFVARNVTAGDGIQGEAGTGGVGVQGTSQGGIGVRGSSDWIGVVGAGTSGGGGVSAPPTAAWAWRATATAATA